MSEDGADPRANRQPFLGHLVGREMKEDRDQALDCDDCEPTFESIRKEHENSGRFAQESEDIGCADVSAANRSNVNPAGFPNEEASWD